MALTPGAIVYPSNPDYCPLKLGPGFPRTMTDIPHILSDDTSHAERIIRSFQGQGVVGNLCGPPHLVPEHVPDADKINKLLRASLIVQAARCSAKPYCLLSTGDLSRCGLMRRYLKSIGVDSKVFTGWLCGRKVGMDNPCTWLEIAGETINVTYYSTSAMYFPSRFLTTKEFVKGRLPEDVKNRLTLADDVGNGNYFTCDVNRRYSKLVLDQMEQYGNTDHIDKFEAFGGRFKAPNGVVYEELMEKYIREEFGVEVLNLKEEWAKKCWGCLEEKPKDALKKCTVCHIALYCDTKCQKSDWKRHKLLHLKHEGMFSPERE